jgi:hypothetical protein
LVCAQAKSEVAERSTKPRFSDTEISINTATDIIKSSSHVFSTQKIIKTKICGPNSYDIIMDTVMLNLQKEYFVCR